MNWLTNQNSRLLQPMTVVKIENNYFIIAGERRFRALKLLAIDEPEKYKETSVLLIEDITIF